MPTVIAITIILLIWWIYPAYTNGTDGVKEKLAQLEEKRGKLADLSSKSVNVDALSGELASIPEEIKILNGFIPEEIIEEVIVDNLSFFASSAKVAISEITVVQPKIDNFVPTDGSLMLNPPSLPQAEIVKTNVKILGNYENIRDFFNSISSLDRYNNFAALRLSRIGSSPEAADVPSNTLVAEIEISFNILKKAKLSDENVGNAVFLKNSLDKEVIARIKDQKNANSFQLSVSQKGKSNPFIP